MVGNPPYMGNKYWRNRVGPDFQRYAERLSGRKLGKPDLVVLFLWRMRVLLKKRGCFGALATQSLTEVQSKRLFADIVLNDADDLPRCAIQKVAGNCQRDSGRSMGAQRSLVGTIHA